MIKRSVINISNGLVKTNRRRLSGFIAI